MEDTQYSRRGCLRIAAGGGLSALVAAGSQRQAAAVERESDVVKIAGYAYDRVRAIQDGRHSLEDFDVQFQTEDIYNLNRLVFGPKQTYEVSEVGLIPYLMKYANEGCRSYTLIPVFISRTFRHRSIYVRTDSGIDSPEDLKGKRVATPGYAMSSHTWIRGMLQDVYGVKPEDMRWIETTKSSDGGNVKSGYEAFFLPDDFPIEKGPEGVDESDMIIAGDVDALITAIEPRAYSEGHPKVRLLFPNVQAAEREYYKQTRVFPIMHAIAVRRDFAATHPELPPALFALYSKAKKEAYKDLETVGALKVTLPWVNQELEETRALMGKNFWKYGLDANRKEMELVMRYIHEQGLVQRRLEVDEVFHPSTLRLCES